MLAHAIIDAILGAAGLGDIGQHFPDTDAALEDADSIELLREVVALLRPPAGSRRARRRDGGARAPEARAATARRSAPRSPARCASARRVHVKATTGEGMGFVGREEGVAALAVATLGCD